MSKGWNRSSSPRDRTRGAKVRVKSARGRKTSSTRWLQRQLNDPYVAEARRLGYRSRAAFKLIELDDRFGFLKKAKRIIDLGSTPGGWSQVVIERLGKDSSILAIDLLEMEPVQGVDFIQGDFLAEGMDEKLIAMLDGPADVVLSDMANSATGHRQTDQVRTLSLCDAALDFSLTILKPGGHFVSKILEGGAQGDLLNRLNRCFDKVHHAKPPSSRAESKEWFLVALGFKGLNREQNIKNDQ